MTFQIPVIGEISNDQKYPTGATLAHGGLIRLQPIGLSLTGLLVETVTEFRNPSHPGGVAVKIVGRLNALLGEQAYPQNVRGGKMVAGEGLDTTT